MLVSSSVFFVICAMLNSRFSLRDELNPGGVVPASIGAIVVMGPFLPIEQMTN